jgi:sulfite dehydrogenase (quinone) subunit SoeC
VATQVLGLLAAAMAVVTVLCTGMIYASLKPIRQWHNSYVLPVYMLCSVFSGGACLAAIAWFWRPGVVLVVVTMLFGLIALVAKFAYWRFIDGRSGASTAESATGLGRFGLVRMLDAPHTEENYLLREMGYRIGRKHARTLRGATLLLGFALPVLLVWVAPPLAAVMALLGIYVERWLFFAEATHTVTLYYGRAA